MTDKYRKVFLFILVVTMFFWTFYFLCDILHIWIVALVQEHLHSGGGSSITLGIPLCILVLGVSYIVLRIISRRSKKQHGEEQDEHTK